MSDDSNLIGKATVAAMLGVTTRQVERHEADPDNPLPVAERAPKGSRRGHRYDVRAVHEWAVGRMIAEAPEGLDLQYEKARLTHAQANRQELLAARESGEQVLIQAVAEHVGDDYSRVRARVLACPSKLAPLVAPEQDTATCREIIEREVHQALAELSDPEAVAPAVVEASQ